MQRNITNTIHNTVSQGHVLLNASESKRQKIVAAIYLVTEHLHVDEAFRNEVRTCALSFLSSRDAREEKGVRTHLLSLLSVGSLARLISAKNASIIEHEIKKLVEIVDEYYEDDMTEFFGHESQTHTDTLKRRPVSLAHPQRHFSPTSEIKKTVDIEDLHDKGHERKDISEIKKERKEKILDYINSKRTAVIKDIIALFPDVSEKTVQRELNVLLEENKIEKRGDKRWSLYVAKTLTS